MKKYLTELIEQRYTLLTSTNRLTQHLRAQFAELQIGDGKSAWETPVILSWERWLGAFWSEMTAISGSETIVLTRQQQHSVWYRIIHNSEHSANLIQKAATTRKAIQAWRLCQEYQIDILNSGAYLNQDAIAFSAWAGEYTDKCRLEGWIDQSGLAGDILQNCSHEMARDIALIGFDDLTPQQKNLVAALKSKKFNIKLIPLEEKNHKTRAYGFADASEEITYAANWAGSRLHEHPQESIGIVVPDLHACRQQIESRFNDILQPQEILKFAESLDKPFSISLGKPLLDYPVIDAALTILGLVLQPVDMKDISRLLRTPYINFSDEERVIRGMIDSVLRDYGEPNMSINTLLHVFNDDSENLQLSCEWFSSLKTLHTACQALPRLQSAQEWAASFSRLLAIFNWPGELSKDSGEYQTLEAWREKLTEFAGLDLVINKLSYQTALTQLRQILINSNFQPETAETPIQVMGIEGAAGMQFDHLWVSGLHEDVWPPNADTNPFIPISLQYEAGVPDATAELQLAYSRNLTERLIRSTGDIVFSYPLYENERRLRPSPLISGYGVQGAGPDFELSPDYLRSIHASRRLESLEDDMAPAVSADNKIRGGTAIFKDQSACPFRAFARHRLSARGLSEIDIGLDARMRGLLIHTVLQGLWNQLGDQETLKSKSERALDELIEKTVASSINVYKEKRPQTFSARFVRVEKQRLKLILKEWLTQEKSRSPFKVIACEKAHTFEFETVLIKTRVDRIDRLSNGNQVIIDYKTGRADVAQWLGERVEEPQLPLYISAATADVDAVSFAKIRRGESGYTGLSKDDGILPGTKAFTETKYANDYASWEALLNAWRERLGVLIKEFRCGVAKVEPRDVNCCRYCDLHSLCRIHEIRSNQDGFEEIKD